MKWTERLVAFNFEPVRAIEWVIVLCTLAGGLYVFTPLYDISQLSAPSGIIAQIFASPDAVVIFGILLIIGSLLIIAGIVLKKSRLRSAGWFLLAMVRLFQILSTFMVVGFLPITWIYLLIIMLVMLILWAKARIEVYSHVT